MHPQYEQRAYATCVKVCGFLLRSKLYQTWLPSTLSVTLTTCCSFSTARPTTHGFSKHYIFKLALYICTFPKNQ